MCDESMWEHAKLNGETQINNPVMVDDKYT